MPSSADDEDHECAYLANPVHSATHVGRHRPHFPFINAKSIWMHISCANFLLRTTYHHVEGVHTKVHWNRVCAEQIFWPEIGQFAREDGIRVGPKHNSKKVASNFAGNQIFSLPFTYKQKGKYTKFPQHQVYENMKTISQQ